MDFEGEGIIPGYKDYIEPVKKREVVQCPECDAYKLIRVKRNLWICENCGFETEDGE